jgi:hypothetical protein
MKYTEDDNNFKVAKQLSFDLSSEFRGFTPRQEGFVQQCIIGEADVVEFREPGYEEEKVGSDEKPVVTGQESEEELSSDEASSEEVSATQS